MSRGAPSTWTSTSRPSRSTSQRPALPGALFDFNKLASVARSRVANMTQDEVFAAVSDWAARYQPALLEEIRRDEARFRASIDLWHENRMDVAKWSDLMEMYPISMTAPTASRTSPCGEVRESPRLHPRHPAGVSGGLRLR